ncbi:GntR family transcriptional regulator [Salinibacterium sp. NK8237]|uniref:GntR family transcriptional regulator n=1 Tax=Salinibacterium sp. NK8237 TaxID=2792038 RepID=UPI0018CF7EA2|nr:GntR family transcriptional regulator [Salinibacterium sp. NK8237]MBH0130103.1 GntR family transcriptional regulator [Salinibacterium sp. NK8237]
MNDIDGGSTQPARTISNTEDVYTRLRALLLNGEIPPGAILSQVQLAKQLAVSTTPLREAMRLLQAEGLLVAEHNRRSRVTPLNPRDIDSVYASRIVMEALAIRLTVPTLGPTEIEALRAAVKGMADAAEAQDLSAWEPIHADFHRRITSGCDEQMSRIIESVSDHTERYRRSSLFGSPARTWEIGNEEHQSILAACEAGQPAEASILLARHLARSALTVLAKVAPEENPIAVREALLMVQKAAESK